MSVSLPLLVTHGGKFHLDEVFAYAVLRRALQLGPSGSDHLLVRTRDPARIAAGKIVWDVGTVYDEATERYDHHQRGAPLRPDGTPYSSAGLVWRIYGERAVLAVLGGRDADLAGPIAAEIDGGMVRRIDEVDNGIGPEGDSLGLSGLMGDFNPPWDAAGGDAAADAAFLDAAELADGLLCRRVARVAARLRGAALVRQAFRSAADPRILELDRGMPWKDVVFADGLPVLFGIYPASNGNWMVDAVPPEPGSFAQRLPLPAAWAGLQDQALADISGVPDAVFVHLRCFVAAARSREGARALAARAIALAEETP
ncbi:MYG1 family protein [Rhizosaccharibacter radicis]|uniref:MYG1 family protein n=1 Tax=Rhizosaccharibacter radicis TaxID=2782605 RepID=A0ABT1VUY6_9PROT|nr:MYG1 family protein [Acetobacteraceae bacterium KSS12]